MKKKSCKVIIIGGGLAGLTCALHLSNHGFSVQLFEKYTYPHHKVCGEYISNEVVPYLKSLGVDPFAHGAVAISKLLISNTDGTIIKSQLPLGGFGISRHSLDQILYETVKDQVATVFDSVENIEFNNDRFYIRTTNKDSYEADFVVGAYGKRSALDKHLDRSFTKKKTPWLAVKAHYKQDRAKDTVELHNFIGGYCGISSVENNLVNVCYLASYDNFKPFGSIETFQKEVLQQNKHLNQFFKEAQMVFNKPLSIAQISFDSKEPVEDHVFMIGDSAGLIHPLCGNGMAMAIHGAKLFSEIFISEFSKKEFNRAVLERNYRFKWRATFHKRLTTGKWLQPIFLNESASRLGLQIANRFPQIIPKIIKRTHGKLLV